MPPSTNYASANIVNPTSVLSDFSIIIDLSRMPSEWWDSANTSDGRYGRAYKGDGTELACDWIEFNSVARTGLLVVKWSGSMLTTGTHTLHVYPPNTANSLVLVTDTYGGHNAYDSAWEAYWPLTSDGNDRTANQHHATAEGGLVFGGDSGGVLGNATEFVKASKQRATAVASSAFISTNNEATLTAFTKGVRDTWNGVLSFNLGGSNQYLDLRQRGVSDDMSFYAWQGSEIRGGNFTAGGGWHAYEAQTSAAGSELFEDGVSIASSATPSVLNDSVVIEQVRLGAAAVTNQEWNGSLQHLSYQKSVRSSAWLDHWRDLIEDQSAMFGTWTDNPVAGESRRRVMIVG